MSFTSSNAHYDLHVRLVPVAHTLIHSSLNHSLSQSLALSLFLSLYLYLSLSESLCLLPKSVGPRIFICFELSAPLVPGQPSRLWLTPSTLKYGNQYSQCLNPSASIHVRPPRPSVRLTPKLNLQILLLYYRKKDIRIITPSKFHKHTEAIYYLDTFPY